MLKDFSYSRDFCFFGLSPWHWATVGPVHVWVHRHAEAECMTHNCAVFCPGKVLRLEKVMTLLCIWSVASLDLSNSVTPPGVGGHFPLSLQGPTFTPLTFILTSFLKPFWSYTLTDESPESRWEKKIWVAKNVDIFHLSCLQLLPWAHSSYAKQAAESACGIFFSPPFHLSGYKQAASF